MNFLREAVFRGKARRTHRDALAHSGIAAVKSAPDLTLSRLTSSKSHPAAKPLHIKQTSVKLLFYFNLADPHLFN